MKLSEHSNLAGWGLLLLAFGNEPERFARPDPERNAGPNHKVLFRCAFRILSR